jgi:hypothetical protein
VSHCHGFTTARTRAYNLQERKYFDSGDFAISKASNDSVTGHPHTGKQHPAASILPHLSSPVPSDSNVKHDADSSQHRRMSGLGVSASPRTDHQYQQKELENSKRGTTVVDNSEKDLTCAEY